jgi:hypothetical protein
LNENTKLEIAIWLLDSKPSKVNFGFTLPQAVLDGVRRLFGRMLPTERSLTKTWKAVGVLTCCLAAISLLQPHSISRTILAVYTKNGGFEASNFFGCFFFTSLFAAIGTHWAFMATRVITERVATARSVGQLYGLFALSITVAALFLPLAIAFLLILGSFDPEVRGLLSKWADRRPTIQEIVLCSRTAVTKTQPFVLIVTPMAVANVFTTLWVNVGLGSAYTLKLFSRFLIGFNWFTRTFDIERRPLSSIGLVAGALVAAVYWLVVLVEWGVHRHG